MVTGRGVSRKRLAIMAAFGVLVAVAIGAGCSGFFVDPTLTSITIDGNTSVEVNHSTTLSAFGVYGNTGGNTLTSGVSWSSETPTVAQITGACASGECGSVTIQGVTAGTSTVSATSQSVTNTATVTVFLGSVTGYQVCMGSFGATTTCSNGNTPLPWNANVTTSQVQQDFIVQGTSDGTLFDLTTQSTWTVNGTPAAGSIQCDASASPAVCTVDSGTTQGTYSITITYPANATNPTNTATITVNVQG
jgi:hypothetical protein